MSATKLMNTIDSQVNSQDAKREEAMMWIVPEEYLPR